MKKVFSGCIVALICLTGLVWGAGQRIANLMSIREGTPHPYHGTGRVVYEKTFQGAQSSFLAVYFANFNLAEGDYVEISDPGKNQVVIYAGKGKLTADKRVITGFWSRMIRGPELIIRLISKKNNTKSYGFDITKLSIGYPQDRLRAQSRSICGTDEDQWAKCYDTDTDRPKYEKARAVARLFINAETACTGWLVGSEGHLMTNHHCIGSQPDANNTEYEFMGEGETCETDCSAMMSCRGTVEATSGQLIQTDYVADFSLILLPGNLSQKYGYLQMRSSLPAINEQIYIPQHGAGQGKQLAVASTDSNDESGLAEIASLDEPPCLNSGPGDIGYFADTQIGSSGAPVIASADNLVVALHHCGECPNRGVPLPYIISLLGSAGLPTDSLSGPFIQAAFSHSGKDKLYQFQNQSYGISCSINSYSWDFGDGATATEAHPSHTYLDNGRYTVTLTVAGDCQLTHTTWKTVRIPWEPEYCEAKSTDSTYEWISDVAIGGFSNPSGNGSYSDFTHLTIEMETGTETPVTLTPHFDSDLYPEYFTIWIDLNRDGDFSDAGEELFTQAATAPVSGQIILPALTGSLTTRLRIAMKWNAAATPCETFAYGEVEDYTVHITGTPPEKDDLVGSYAGIGVWLREGDDGSWSRIVPDEASQVVSGDIDGNGIDDLLGIWTAGIWVRFDNGQWQKMLDSDGLTWLTAGDLNSDGKDDLIGSWPIGVWKRDSASGNWSRLTDLPASQLVCGDIDKDGGDDLIGVWAIGIWANYANGTWQQLLSANDLKYLALGDMNGDGYMDILGSWTHGAWYRDSVSADWHKLYESAELVSAADLNGDLLDELIGAWTGVPGLWARSADGQWQKLTNEKAVSLARGKLN